MPDSSSDNLPDIDALKKSLKSAADYKARIAVVDDLGRHKTQQTKDILWRVMLNDPIHSVQNQAFLKLQAFGEEVRLPRKNPKHLKLASSKIPIIQRLVDFFEDEDSFFKVFKEKYPREFEILSYEKGGKLNAFITNKITNMPKR